jgi:hypothetical protein
MDRVIVQTASEHEGCKRMLAIPGSVPRGNPYLRMLFVQGARAVLQRRSHQPSGLSRWLERLTSHKHGKVAVVALANKLARMAWAVLARDQPCRPPVQRAGLVPMSFLRHEQIYRPMGYSLLAGDGAVADFSPGPIVSMSSQLAIPESGCTPALPGLRFTSRNHLRSTG